MVAEKLANMPAHRLAGSAQICAVSQSDAVDMLNVSRRTVQTAAKVRSEAPDELVQAVEQGTVSVSLAAQVAGVECETRDYEGDDPLAFVLSLNLKRRQLTASQLAFVALEIEKYQAGLAKGRQGTSSSFHQNRY